MFPLNGDCKSQQQGHEACLSRLDTSRRRPTLCISLLRLESPVAVSRFTNYHQRILAFLAKEMGKTFF